MYAADEKATGEHGGGREQCYNCVAVRRASGRTHLLDEVIKTNMMDQSIFAFLRIVLLPSHSASDEKLHSVFLRAQQI